MAFTKGTANFTNGSKTVTGVSLTAGQLAYFASGTAVFIQSEGKLIEATGLPKDGNGDVIPNQFLLRGSWIGLTGSYEFVAFDTIEGLRDAVQSARGFSTQLQAVLDNVDVNPTADSFVKRNSRGAVKTADAVDGNDAVAKKQTGTAFSRDVGTASGNVMEVGAFGLGTVFNSAATGTAGASTGYVKIATVNGSYSSAGDSLTLLALGFGDIASRLRDDYIIQIGERFDNITCSVFSLRPGASENRFYTKKVADFKYELWAALDVYDSGGSIVQLTTPLRSGTGITIGQVQTTTPTGLVQAQIARTFTYQGGGGYFTNITGDTLNISGSKNFRIDNPANPDEYLYHSAIESDKPRTQYVLEIDVDSTLEATHTMPDWFHGLNGNTCIVFCSPCKHFGDAYGEVTDGVLTLSANTEGRYHVLIIAERSDNNIADWVLTEPKPTKEGLEE